MAKRYYNLEKETKAFLKRMEGTSGFSLNNAGVQAVNNYFIFRKANARSIPNSTSTLTKSFAGGVGANTQYMSCPSNSTLDFTTNPLTWMIWVKTNSSTGSIVGKGQGGPLIFINSNVLRFAKGGVSDVSSSVSPNNTWQLAACWYDGTNYYIQINNGTIVSAVLSGGFTSNATDFRIGAPRAFLDPSLPGQASRMWQWSRVLTADERTLLYNSGSGRSFLEAIYYSPSLLNGLISYWPLNELSGTSDGRDLYGTNTLIANNNPTVTAGIIEEIL
jgi:hypothetical protein